MDAKFLIDNISYSVDFSSFNDLSIPINFNGKQPNTYGVAVSYTHLRAHETS